MREGYRTRLREVLHVSDNSMSLLTGALGLRGDDVVNPTEIGWRSPISSLRPGEKHTRGGGATWCV
jgi:hypothetical protein